MFYLNLKENVINYKNQFKKWITLIFGDRVIQNISFILIFGFNSW
jgi:phage anti-repressor protein